MVIHVTTKQREYDIVQEKGSLDKLNQYIDLNRNVFIVSDTGVPSALQEKVLAQCPQGTLHVVPMGEGSKSFSTYEECLRKMLELNFHRKDLVIALGGGVVGDLAGFVAASYMRGIEFMNIPTTTLSQIDSSIGGKVAINVDGIKNCVGAFWQPSLVLMDSNVLSTLTKRHFYNGLIESLKAGLIADPSLFELFEKEDIESHLDEIIYKALLVKKEVVEEDETEQGRRKILNFGHTIGHAIESYYHLGEYYHGECVGLGMIRILEDATLKERVIKVLEKMHCPVTCDGDKEAIYSYIVKDKKADQENITIVKVPEIGKADLVTCKISDLKKYC